MDKIFFKKLYDIQSIISYEKEANRKYGRRCFYCNGRLTNFWEVEHKIPRSRGGSDKIENLVPACTICNGSKHARTFEEWLLLLQSRLKYRQAQVSKIKRIIKKVKLILNE